MENARRILPTICNEFILVLEALRRRGDGAVVQMTSHSPMRNISNKSMIGFALRSCVWLRSWFVLKRSHKVVWDRGERTGTRVGSVRLCWSSVAIRSRRPTYSFELRIGLWLTPWHIAMQPPCLPNDS
jgi:hypothetical protein